jgi:hypothetical protein
MIKLRLTEDQFIRSVKLITESTESTARDRSKQVIRDYFARTMPWWDIDDMFRDPRDRTRPHPDNKYAESNLNYMFRCFEEIFFHPGSALRKSKILRLEPAFVKIAFEAGFQQTRSDSRILNRLRRIIWKMYYLSKESEEESKFITNLPLDVSLDFLNQRYGTLIDQEDAEETDRINNTQYVDAGDYKIIGPITDFEIAHEYAEYTGKPAKSFLINKVDEKIYNDKKAAYEKKQAEKAAKQEAAGEPVEKAEEFPSFKKWAEKQAESTKMCYGMFPITWEDYADVVNGRPQNRVYIALKNGWKEIPPVHDDDGYSGYDTYGLSMIWVIVDENGELQYCNTRWNHAADYAAGRSVDFALSREEISKIIGRNFMQVFK